jgi:hypothetical protein
MNQPASDPPSLNFVEKINRKDFSCLLRKLVAAFSPADDADDFFIQCLRYINGRMLERNFSQRAALSSTQS